MRRVLTGILAAVLTVSLCAATAFAAGPRGGRYYVDADGDGICDNTGSRCAYVDADGDGICDSCGAYHWCGMAGIGGGNFVDADGDGICDRCQSGQGRGCGHGVRGSGFRGGRNR